MNIDSISNGIVIDHITAGRGMKLYELLDLNRLDCSVALLRNVSSQKLGRKDIIKIDERIELDMDVLGYVDPNITINLVKDGKLELKTHLELPETLTNVLECKNPRCITSVEQGAKQRFYLADKEKKIYRCAYCDVEHENK